MSGFRVMVNFGNPTKLNGFYANSNSIADIYLCFKTKFIIISICQTEKKYAICYITGF